MRAIILAIALLLTSASSSIAQSPSPSQTPEQAEFASAKQLVSDWSTLVQEGVAQYEQDALTLPVFEKALTDNFKAFEDIDVSDCFSEWYSLEYATIVLVDFFIANMKSPEDLQQTENPYTTAAVFTAVMSQQAPVSC